MVDSSHTSCDILILNMVFSSLDIETSLWSQGYQLVCGVDEVGRGCFAGPVVAGAVVFSSASKVPQGIADSKLLKPKIREELAIKIKQNAISWSIGEVSVCEINRLGIGKATQLAFLKAVQGLEVDPSFILIDAFYIDNLDKDRQKAVKNGDKLCSSIAAASIIAKVYRDNLMVKLNEDYPQYGFSKHKGYGTKVHQEAIRKHGLSDLHRTSFNLGKFLSS